MALVPDARMEEQHERHIVQYTITVWWYCMEHAHVRVISPTLPSLPTSRQARPRDGIILAIAAMVGARAAPHEVANDVAAESVARREADGDAATPQA